MKIIYLLKTVFMGLIFCTNTFASTLNEDSLSLTINNLETEFNEIENISPAQGYHIHIHFDKATSEYSGSLESIGSREFDTPLEILSVKTCLLCIRYDYLLFNHMKVFYSFGDQLIFAPRMHIPHWFAKEKLEDQKLSELHYALIKSATQFCALIEELFPDKSLFDKSYSFEILCGYHAGQKIPHLYLKIPIENHFTREGWKELRSKFL